LSLDLVATVSAGSVARRWHLPVAPGQPPARRRLVSGHAIARRLIRADASFALSE